MARGGIRVVPKMLDANKCIFDVVAPNGDFRTIAGVHFPMDGQMNDNLEAAQGICDILKKRIRKSV